jgi:hypothetical protein
MIKNGNLGLKKGRAKELFSYLKRTTGSSKPEYVFLNFTFKIFLFFGGPFLPCP